MILHNPIFAESLPTFAFVSLMDVDSIPNTQTPSVLVKHNDFFTRSRDLVFRVSKSDFDTLAFLDLTF